MLTDKDHKTLINKPNKVTFKADSTAIILLKGKGRHAQLSTLPSVQKLLDLALYPTQVLSQFSAPTQRVTLEIQIEGDTGIYATAMKDISIPVGTVPDINLVAYFAASYSLKDDPYYINARKREEGADDISLFKSYEINFILHVESIA